MKNRRLTVLTQPSSRVSTAHGWSTTLMASVLLVAGHPEGLGGVIQREMVGDEASGRSGGRPGVPSRFLELAGAVVVAVGERRHQRDLLDLKVHPQGHRLPETGDDADGATGAHPLDGLVDCTLGAGGVEHGVVVGPRSTSPLRVAPPACDRAG